MYYHREKSTPNPGLLSLEMLAKVVAASTAISFAMAFFFDLCFMGTLGLRMWGLMVLSDHIETAIGIVPLVLALTMVMIGVLLIRLYSPLADLPILFRAILVGIGFALASYVPMYLAGGLRFLTVAPAVGAGVLVAFVEHFLIREELPEEREYRLRRYWFPMLLIGSLLAVTVWATAYARATQLLFMMEKNKADALVWGHDMSSTRGVLILLIERGVILGMRDGDQDKFVFVPRDQIRRLETGLVSNSSGRP